MAENIKVRKEGFEAFWARIIDQMDGWTLARKAGFYAKWCNFVDSGNDVADTWYEDGFVFCVVSPAFERFLREQGLLLPSDTRPSSDGRESPPR